MCDVCDNELAEALETDHPCKGTHGCDIGLAMSEGLYAYAAHLLTGATECDATDAAITAAMKRHSNGVFADGEKAWHALCDSQRKEMLKIEHSQCPHCESTVWEPSDLTTCPNCGKSLDRWYVIPYTRVGEDDIGDMGVALVAARDAESAHEKFDDYVSDVTDDLWGKHVTGNYDTGSAEHSDAGFVYVMRECDCDDDGCWSKLSEEELQSKGSDHESLTTAIVWDASAEPREFATMGAAKEHASNEHRVNEPVVIGGDE